MHKRMRTALKKVMVFVVFSSLIFIAPARPVYATWEEVKDAVPFLLLGPLGTIKFQYVLGKTVAHSVLQKAVKDLDISQLVTSVFTVGVQDPISISAYGRDNDDTAVCAGIGLWNSSDAAGKQKIEAIFADGEFGKLQDAARKLDDGEDCSLNKPLQLTSTGEYSSGAGSLSHLALAMTETAINQPVPVNMAYYVKDYARRLPVIKDTAFAASDDVYNALGLEPVLALWKTSRNISYGIISIAMLIIGIMIMTRRKLNPQAVVTVQNALPRIVIALVLITFSYPIGAFMISLIPGLIGVSFSLFFSQTLDQLVNMDLLGFFNAYFSATFGGGFFLALWVPLFIGVTLVLFFVALIRAFIVYIKILISIVTAPLQFAISAVPGKEGSLTDWFKQISANILAIPSMLFMIGLGWYLLGTFMFSSMFSNYDSAALGSGVGIVASRIFVLALAPLACMFCFSASLGMPKKIKTWIVGDEKPKRR